MSRQQFVEGRVGRDAEMRYTEDGTPVTSFTLAVSNDYQRGGEWVQRDPTWYKVTAWRQRAIDIYGVVQKGQLVVVRGTLGSEAWQGNNNEIRSQLTITASRVFIEAKVGEAMSANGHHPPESDDDMPF